MVPLEGADLVRVREREGDLVDPVQQAMLAERFDLEAKDVRAVERGNALLLEIDGEPESRKGFGLVEELVDLMRRQDDGEQTVLEAVVEEDVAERGRNERAKPVVEQRPRRVLARAAAAEVAARKQYLRALVALLVQHEVGVERAPGRIAPGLAAIEIAPCVEKVGAEAGAVDRLQELLRDDGVGVDVGGVERGHPSGQDGKGWQPLGGRTG